MADTRSPWAPLAHPGFRMLWLVSCASTICQWMSEVASAWLMTSMTTSAAMVALVQTAATLPIFLLALPAGALADMLDRHRMLVGVQVWTAAVAVANLAALMLQAMSPLLLLGLTFCNGMVMALRFPAIAAEIPATVPRKEIPLAMGLNSVAFNASRMGAPLLAGVLIASFGSEAVFLLNAVLASLTAVALWRHGRRPMPPTAAREPFVHAMRVGLQYVLHSPRMPPLLLRLVLFFGQAAALNALLPLVARELPGSGPGTFALLVGAMGAGAVAAILLILPRLRDRVPPDAMVRLGYFAMGAACLCVSLARWTPLLVLALFAAGIANTLAANSLTVQAQLSLAGWVRARGMAIHMCVLMGSNAVGAALWGQLADAAGIPVALAAAAFAGLLSVAITSRVPLPEADPHDLDPHGLHPQPPQFAAKQAEQAEILVTIRYCIAAERTGEFLEVMEQTRRRRLQRGAQGWELFQDLDVPHRYTEHFRAASWSEHVRGVERLSASDLALRDSRNALHQGPDEPVVTRSARQPTAQRTASTEAAAQGLPPT